MPQFKIYGASDDLIEVEGKPIQDEFNWYSDDKPCYLNFSDGTQLSCLYDQDGIWRFARTREGSATMRHEPGSVEEDRSDVVYLDGDIAWVEQWEEAVPTQKNMAEKMSELADRFRFWHDMPIEKLRAIYEIVRGRSVS